MMIKNEKILITGGAGSLGKELTKILCINNDIVIYSRNEERQFEMRQEFGDKNISYMIGDVRDEKTLTDSMRNCTIAIHAAAMKDTIVCENQAIQTCLNNITGSIAFLEAVKKTKTLKKVCGVSTDKAASPSSVYGCSKYIMEQIFREASKFSDCIVSSVRFGNMIDSRGSIITEWKMNPEKDIKITHMDVARFFFSVNDGAMTVIEALNHASNGELFIKKMKKAKIFNILKTITGRKKFDVIGLFPGEKVHEELLSANECSFCFESDDYYIVKPGKSNPNPPEIFSTLNASEYSDDELKVLLNYSN